MILLERNLTIDEAMQEFSIDTLMLSPEELKSIYRRLSMQHHPDRNPGDASKIDKMARVNQAYEILKQNLGRQRPVHQNMSYGASPGPSRTRTGGRSTDDILARLARQYAQYVELWPDGIHLYPLTKHVPLYIVAKRYPASDHTYYMFTTLVGRRGSTPVSRGLMLQDIEVDETEENLAKLIRVFANIDRESRNMTASKRKNPLDMFALIEWSIAHYFG